MDAVLALPERPAWQANAACRDYPEIDWFNDEAPRTGAAHLRRGHSFAAG
jgi:hypothetical protein